MKKIAYNQIVMMAAAGVLCIIIGICGAAGKQTQGDYWKTKENITRRLSAEWHKTLTLENELGAVGDVLATLQDFEYYPQELTGIGDMQLAAFDRSIEVLQKKGREIQTDVEALKAPVVDALKIIREMVVDEPVESMFETLESGNIGRINEILRVKHAIDTLWIRVDSAISGVYLQSGLHDKPAKVNGVIEDEFFELLKANIGMQSQRYYERINRLRMHVITRAQLAEQQLVERVDLVRIKKYLDDKKDMLALRRISDALQCHAESAAFTAELNSLLAGIHLRSGNFIAALAVETLLPAGKEYARIKILTRLQSNYALERYVEVLGDTGTVELLSLKGEDLNHAIWTVMESALRVGRPEVALRFAGFSDKTAPFGMYVIHALARAFMATDGDSTALAVVRLGTAMKPLGRDDVNALQELDIMQAELLFEQGRYRESSTLFFRQLNAPGLFERALAGIAWCYIKTGEFENAEITLRKLINQSPESVAGVEGIAILAKRNVQAAGSAWKKYAVVEREKKRIAEMFSKLERVEVTGGSSEKLEEIVKARAHLRELMNRVDAEPLADYRAIAALYQNAEKLCSFITSHYYTGTFQEVTFSKGRERVLGIVDSVLAEIASQGTTGENENPSGTPSLEKVKIKQISDEALLLSVVIRLNRYQWEKAYLEWRKKEINQNAAETGRSPDSVAENRTPEKIRRAAIDSLIVFEREIDEYYSERLIKEIGTLLALSLRDEDRCYLEYQKAELIYKKENARYTELFDAYEKAGVRSLVPGDAAPIPPTLDHRQSMIHYRAALVTSADSLFVGGALYGLGWCFNDIGMFDSAYYYMRYLAEHYSESPHTPQAWMYCGEYNFDKGMLDSALAAFYRVMKYPESEWFDDALYKVAWTQYRLSNPEKAISSFLALVDLGKGNSGRSLLERESMDYVAISFSEIDITGKNGLRRAAAFVKKLGDKRRACAILHRLAQVYREQGRYDIAIATYELILSTYPDYERNPQVEAEMLLVQERDAPAATTLEQKYAYYKKYNRFGVWAQKQLDSVKYAADSVSAKMLYDVAVSYHQMALQDKDDTLYANATRSYRDFITMYKKLPLANECHYNLAEIEFSLGNYPDAALEFMAVSREYPDSKYRETAAWNAIVAAQYILKQESAGKEMVK